MITVAWHRGVTNLHHYKEFSSRELKVGQGVRFRFRILTSLLVVVSLLDEVNHSRWCPHFSASVHLDELLSFHWGSIVLTNRLGVNSRGLDRYQVSQPGWSKGMGCNVSLEFKLRGIHQEKQKKVWASQADKHAFDADDGWWTGVQSIRHKHDIGPNIAR